MPKNTKGAPRRRRQRGAPRQSNRPNDGANTIFRCMGRAFSTTNASASANTQTLTENNLTISLLGDRLLALGDVFAEFRIVQMKVRQVFQMGANTTAATAGYGTNGDTCYHSLAFVPAASADFTTATTYAQLVDFPEFAFDNALRPITIRVGRSGLIGSQMSKWLSTGTNTNASLLSAGVVVTGSVTGPVADTSLVGRLRTEYIFHVEFRTPIDGSINPMYKPLRLMQSLSESPMKGLGKERISPDEEKKEKPKDTVGDLRGNNKGWTLPFL